MILIAISKKVDLALSKKVTSVNKDGFFQEKMVTPLGSIGP